LIWFEEAVQDIARLRLFLETKNPRAARRAARCILDGAKMLQHHPEAGAPMGDGRRELFLPFGDSAYVLRYRLDGDDVLIIRVWHGREQRHDE
jgi:plasmid stabilization system protein ParE